MFTLNAIIIIVNRKMHRQIIMCARLCVCVCGWVHVCVHYVRAYTLTFRVGHVQDMVEQFTVL